MKPDDRLSMYRLVERLGRGGFAEVWRARAEPARALADGDADPSTLARWLRAVTEVLLVRDGPHAPARPVVHHLAQTLDALGSGDARPAVRDGVVAAARDALVWVEELCAPGELDVALKVPFHDGYVRQMRREKDILVRVPHPRLVRQLELDLAHEPPFLAMELVRGWSLREALKTEPLPPMAKVLAVMDQLLTVLDHLHRRGMVHGDVKPENIMLEPDGSLRLIDLGLGQVSQAVLRDAYLSLSLASRVPLQGTLSYMAPEVRKGEPPGPAADLFSAGILLYEMLVGDVPHGMTLPTEAVPERELSPRFDVLLKWVLHPEPTRRIPSARELRERILITLRERPRHQLGTGTKAAPREGTLSFDQWALEHASPFVHGDWVGPFQLEEPLGRGGFGEVWRAVRQGAQEQVALKIALGAHGKDALVREAEVTGRLEHPQIPALLEAHLDHDPPFLAIGFVPGRSLRARLNEDGPLTPVEAVLAARSLVDALAHCHARGVVHRDLKPENLMLAEPGLTLHLLDFGLASAPDDDARQAPRAELSGPLQSREAGGGTYEYMAPERRRGEPGGPPADVYAVGAILFEALTLELPRGLTRLRELCPAAPGGLEALVERLLDPDPARRPGLADAAALLERERPKDEERLLRRATARRRAPARVIPWERVAVGLLALSSAALLAAGAGFVLRGLPAPTRSDAGWLVTATARDAQDVLASPAAAVRLHEEALLRELDRARAEAPADAARAELRLARLSALRRRREEVEALVEQGRWRLSQAASERATWRPGASVRALEAARPGLEHAAQACGLLGRALELDPLSADAGDWGQDLGRAVAVRDAWLDELLAAAVEAGRDALTRGRADDVAALAWLLLERAGGDARVDAALDALGPASRAHAAEAYARRALHELEAGRLDHALGAWGRLVALGHASAPTARAIGEASARVIEGRRLRAAAGLPGVSPSRAAALLEGAARLLPAAEHPGRALARARGARDAEGLDPATCLARARRLLWQDLGPPDHAVAMLERAEAEAPGRPEVLRVLAAGLALSGDPPAARAVARRPALADGRLLALVARYEEALKVMPRAGAITPAATRDLSRRALALERAGWALREAADAP